MATIGLRKKESKFLIIPIVILFIYSIYSGFNKLEEKKLYDKLHKYVHFSITSSELIHELQKERGYSSGYRASKGKYFFKELILQRKLTDEKIVKLKIFLKDFDLDNYKLSLKSPIKKILTSLDKLDYNRLEIDKKSINNLEILNYYTKNIKRLLDLIENIGTFSKDSDFTVLAQSYITMMQLKEKAGLERALVSKVLSKGKLLNSDFYKFSSLVTAQDIYMQYFKSSSSQKYIDKLNENSYKESFKSLTIERNIIFAKNEKNEILSYIKEEVGYAGLIHNFKNYVIRGKPKYKKQVKEHFAQLLVLIDKYKKIDNISEEELSGLETIKEVFTEYRNNLDEITNFYNTGGSIRALDNIVKVDDYPAKKSLHKLTSNIYASELDWFTYSTKRINLLKDIEDDLAKDLHVMIEKNNVDNIIDIIIQFIILIIVFIILFILIRMLKDLINSEKILNMAQENTKSGSYEYHVKDNYIVWSDEHYKLLGIDKKTVRPSFEAFTVFVHPEDMNILMNGIELATTSKKIVFFDYRIILYDHSIKYVRSSAEVLKYDNKGEALVIVGTLADVTDFKKLEQEIVDTQKDVVFTMGAIGETRSKETGNHVKRVAEYSKLLSLLNGGTIEEAELLKMASPMHDIGKVGIPDNILNKPGKLTPGEWAIMQTHSEMGYDMLKNSNREILKLAATVALTHHERYDGDGYPHGLIGNDIPLVGRVTALADVFDALGSDRCYKTAWELDKILELIKDERGKQFDPVLVDLFMDNLDKFLEIREKYKEEE